MRERSSANAAVAASAAVGAGVAHFFGPGWWPIGIGLGAVGIALALSTSRAAWAALGVCATVGGFIDLALTMHASDLRDGGMVAALLAVQIVLVLTAIHAVGPMRPRAAARLLAMAVVGLMVMPAVSVRAFPPTTPTMCVTPNRSLTLYAEDLGTWPNGIPRLAYGLTPSSASVPGPLIELTEGDCLAVTLVNDVSAATLQRLRDQGQWPADPKLPLGLSLHPHGVRYSQLGDGTVHTNSFARPGGARTYVWYAAPRITAAGRVVSPGSAGYWWYHDHVGGTDHGTGGINAGLWGGLIVRRPSDPRPDRTYVVGMGGPAPLINFRRFPDTFACDRNGNTPGPDCFVATEGQRVEFVVIGVPGTVSSEDMHEFHLHGHAWADNRTGLLSAPDDDVRVIDAKSVGPSESWGFQVVAGDEVGAGDWMLHCHIQGHSDRGMATFFRVLPSDTVVVPSPGAVDATHVHGAP